jgi:uncharacterized membrane protein
MSAKRTALVFALLLLVFLALDGIWLALAGTRLYRPAIGHLMRDGFDIGAAALFYLLYVAALLYFVLPPARDNLHALRRGALFGLVAYATYDLTNQATLRGWPWHVTLVDLAWGAFVTGASCAITYRLTRRRQPG